MLTWNVTLLTVLIISFTVTLIVVAFVCFFVLGFLGGLFCAGFGVSFFSTCYCGFMKWGKGTSQLDKGKEKNNFLFINYKRMQIALTLVLSFFSNSVICLFLLK